MKTFILLAFTLSSIYSNTNEMLYDLKSEGLEQYQDILINGEVYQKASYGERYLEDRFAIVNSILKKYERPFTMLDIGASQGYFSLKAAGMYPDSVFVMLEGSNNVYPKISKQLASICKLNTQVENLIWLDKSIVPDDIANLSRCEHFDVTLLLNIVHWFPNNWKQMIEAAYSMSHVTILEVPPSNNKLGLANIQLRNEIHSYLSNKASQVIQGVKRHTQQSLYTTYYILENKGPFFLQRTTLLHNKMHSREHKIICNYEIKKFHKKDLNLVGETYINEWEPGINFLSYAMLHGMHPSRDEISSLLPVDKDHRDWSLNNMIIQGKKLALIDINDKKNQEGGEGGNNIYDIRWHQRIKSLMYEENPQVFKRKFWALWGLRIPRSE